MRKLAVIGAIGALGVVGAAAALAQETFPSMSVTPTVTPNKAGTPKHPQGVHLRTVFRWQSLGSANQPIVTTFFLKFPRGSKYNGARYPTCSVRVMNARGPGACPKASIMGGGTGNAYADTTITHPQITVVNGGANTVYFYTVLNNPARVQEPVVGHIKRLSGRWAYSLSVTVPQNLRVVAGVPIELTYLNVHAGSGNWLATTACPGGHWPFTVTTTYEDPNTNATGQYTDNSTTPCRR